jgi:pyruvate/oxaloacetate carboxyltransferase
LADGKSERCQSQNSKVYNVRAYVDWLIREAIELEVHSLYMKKEDGLMLSKSRKWFIHSLKADSHIACRAHAVPLPCRSLIHTCHATPLPCSDSAMSFVKACVVAGNIRTASPTV